MFSITYGSVFSRILSKERLDISISKSAGTASFNMKERHLTLPDWKLSHAAQRFLLCHEVSHATHTPVEDWIEAINARPENERMAYASVLNVVEDARIDRLYMSIYPIMKSWYRDGTKEIIDSKVIDFGNADPEVSGLLVNRVNTYFKTRIIGDPFAVKFSAKEKGIVDRIGRAKTFADVKQLADELFQSLPKEMRETPAPVEIVIQIGDNFNPTDGEGKSLIDLPASIKGEIEKFVKKRSKRPPKAPHNPDTLILQDHDFRKVVVKSAPAARGNSFGHGNFAVVNHMASTFERKKAARVLRSIQAAKTGEIDFLRLHEYPFNDDLFLTKNITKDGKNHGFIMFVDCSSSMSDIFPNVIDHMRTLALFCKRVGIPFVAYGFQNGYNRASELSGSRFELVEFVNSTMRRSEIIGRAAELRNKSLHSSTPLTDTIHYAKTIALDFRNKHGIDVLNVIFLTDGECTETKPHSYYFDAKGKILVPMINNIHDEADGTASFMAILRERTNANVFVYFLDESSKFTYKENHAGTTGVYYIGKQILDQKPKMFVEHFIGNISASKG